MEKNKLFTSLVVSLFVSGEDATVENDIILAMDTAGILVSSIL